MSKPRKLSNGSEKTIVFNFFNFLNFFNFPFLRKLSNNITEGSSYLLQS